MENKTDIVPCCVESQEFGPNEHSDDCPNKDYPHRFTVCVSVGGVVQFFDLTRAEIEETWRTVQASILPQTFVGWYDERDKWTQLGTKPAKF